MATRSPPPKRGRPPGSRSFDATSARAFGAVLRDTRLAKGHSQEALAFEAGLGRDHLSRLERGQTQPTLYAMLRLAAALGVPASKLVTLTERALSKTAEAPTDGRTTS